MGLVLLAVTAAAPAPPETIRPPDIVAHLEKVIAWYRDMSTVSPPAVDVLIADDLHATSLQALRLSFSFARAESDLLGAANPSPGAAASGTLQPAAEKAAARVASVQSRIAQIEAELPRAVGKNRQTLIAQRNELHAELDLAKEIQTTVQNLVNFNGIGNSDGSLASQIAELERTVPQAAGKNAPPAAAPKNNAERAPFSPETAGVIGLATELFNNHDNRSHLSGLLSSTQAVAASIDKLKGPLIDQARQFTTRSDQITSQAAQQNAQQLEADQQELNDLAAQFKQLSTAIVPLGEEGIAVSNAESYLEESISTLDQSSTRTGRYLIVKAIELVVVIFIVFAVGEVWRRATFRYVKDSRRRRQFLVLRRVALSIAITLAVVFWFVSELGSLATYAGFVTAGVAVALQSPILSVVAYFFLIGRYGIRVGDRVTISGVTGDVIEIGLVRLYLAELTGTGSDLHPTGRVVVFSNSVIFQPSALYKQMPGIDYVWHTAVAILTPDADFQLAEKTLAAAIEAVYQPYHDELERQYRSLEQSVDVHMAAPTPESRLRFTDAGLQYTVRYPAEVSHASEMDNQILRALHDAVSNEPKLKFAPNGEPKIQTP